MPKSKKPGFDPTKAWNLAKLLENLDQKIKRSKI